MKLLSAVLLACLLCSTAAAPVDVFVRISASNPSATSFMAGAQATIPGLMGPVFGYVNNQFINYVQLAGVPTVDAFASDGSTFAEFVLKTDVAIGAQASNTNGIEVAIRSALAAIIGNSAKVDVDYLCIGSDKATCQARTQVGTVFEGLPGQVDKYAFLFALLAANQGNESFPFQIHNALKGAAPNACGMEWMVFLDAEVHGNVLGLTVQPTPEPTGCTAQQLSALLQAEAQSTFFSASGPFAGGAAKETCTTSADSAAQFCSDGACSGAGCVSSDACATTAETINVGCSTYSTGDHATGGKTAGIKWSETGGVQCP